MPLFGKKDRESGDSGKKGLLDGLFNRDRETIRRAEPVDSYERTSAKNPVNVEPTRSYTSAKNPQDVQPTARENKPGTWLSRTLGITKTAEIVEQGGGVGVAVTVNNIGDVSAQPTGFFHRRKTSTRTDESGVEQAQDKRLTIDAPNLRSSFGPRMVDREGVHSQRDRVTGPFSGNDQKNFTTEIVSSSNGNTVTGAASGRIVPGSTRGKGGSFEVQTTSTSQRSADGTHYTEQGRGFWRSVGDVFRRKEDTAITIEGEGYRAHDKSKMGTIAHDKFVIRNANTGEARYVSEASIARAEREGKTVTEFIHQETKANGKRGSYYLERLTQDPSDSTKYKFSIVDNGNNAWWRREGGSGHVSIDKNGDLTDSRNGSRVIVAANAKTLSFAANASVFASKDTTDLQIATGRDGKPIVVAGESRQKEVSAGIGAKAGATGVGAFGFLFGQKSKQTMDTAETFIAKEITHTGGAVSERVAKIQAALSEKGYYRSEDVDGRAVKNGATVQAIHNYYADGGSAKKLESVINSRAVTRDPAVIAVHDRIHDFWKDRMVDVKDFPKYQGAPITIAGHTFTADQVNKEVQSTLSKMGDALPGVKGKQLPSDMTIALYVDKNGDLNAADPRQSGTYGKKIGGVEFVAYSINGATLSPAGHGVSITSLNIDDNRAACKTTTKTITTSGHTMPTVLVDPVIIPGKKEKPPEKTTPTPDTPTPTPTPTPPTPTPSVPTPPTPTPSVPTPPPPPPPPAPSVVGSVDPMAAPKNLQESLKQFEESKGKPPSQNGIPVEQLASIKPPSTDTKQV